MIAKKNGNSAFAGTAFMCALLASSAFVSNGCFTTGEIIAHCKDNIPPDADPNHECTDPPDGGVEGGSLSPESITCEGNGGACVEIGASDFEHDAVLLWLGEDEMDAPKCPERAA